MQPGYRTAGYHNSTAASWGGNVVYQRGKCHLFVAQMTNGCGLEHWGSNSAIIRAEGASLGGTFHYVDTIVAPFGHNPTARLLRNGTVVVFFIGGSPSRQANCSKGPDARVGKAARGAIHAVSAPSVLGPWTAPLPIEFVKDCPVCEAWSGGGTNPSPHFHDDETVTLAVQRGYHANPDKELIGVARASSWCGPYVVLTPQPIKPERWFCEAGTGEDPFLWQSARGWHMIYHGMCPTGVFQVNDSPPLPHDIVT